MSRPRRSPTGLLAAALIAAILVACSSGEQGVVQAQQHDAVVSLSEEGCPPDTCPVYDMTLHPDGAYTLNSARFVKGAGVTQGNIGKSSFKSAETALKDSGFWELKPQQVKSTMYNCQDGAPTVKITWRTDDGKEKTVTYNAGCNVEKMKDLMRALRASLKFEDLVWTDERFRPDGSH
ncbi:MAG TPA: DUF6438 domain-containing protein [Hyphomonadaceae bacterium]|nr:DUF6438 domain-containing protein [Hyphomonadaceae bacterium]